MLIFLIIILIAFVVGIAYVAHKVWSEKFAKKEYLNKMAHFFEGELVSVPDSAFKRITFKYRGYECFYEDQELPALQRGAVLNTAYLKVKAQSKLSVSFTERERTSIRSNAQTLDDVTKSRWGDTRMAVELPKSLENFHIYTNDSEQALKLVKNKKALRSFELYRNRDSRGHPVLSLKVIDGIVILEFHSGGGLAPSIMELQHNVTATESYLQELIGIAEILQTLTGEKSP